MEVNEQENIKKMIEEKGEEFIKNTFSLMNPEGLLWICSLIEHAQKIHDETKSGLPKDLRPKYQITDFLGPFASISSKKIAEGELLPVNADAFIAVMEYYLEKYGPEESWTKLTDALREAHWAQKFQGTISAREDMPMAGMKKGCLSALLICVLISIAFGYIGLSLIERFTYS